MKTSGRGFTLVEILVAVAIFSIIAAISFTGLANFLKQRDQITLRTQRLHQLQSAMLLLEQDLRFAVSRSVRNGYGDVEGAMASGGVTELAPGELLRFTTLKPDSGNRERQRIERVAWRLRGNTLTRTVWRVMDRDRDSEELTRVVLEGVIAVQLDFLRFDDRTRTLERLDTWLEPLLLPSGVEVLLTLSAEHQVRRLLEVPGGS